MGFASQSGALGLAVVEQARARGLGLSAFVSLGNKADVSSNDLLEYWEDDPATSVVALYLESFGNPLRFGRIARRVARRKPVLALKGGATAAGATSGRLAHGGARELGRGRRCALPAGRRAAHEDALGVPRRRRAALVAAAPARPERRRRHECRRTRDPLRRRLRGQGLELPAPSAATREALRAVMPAEGSRANPIDLLGSATAETFAAVLPLVLADAAFDAVCVLFVRPVLATAADVGRAIDRAVGAGGTNQAGRRRVALGRRHGCLRAARNVSTFSSPESAAAALGVAARRTAWLRRREGVVPALTGVDRARRALVVAEALSRRGRGVARRPAEPAPARGLRHPARARGASPRRRTTRCSQPSPSAGPSWSSRRSQAPTRPRRAAWRSTCATRTPCERPPRASVAACSCSRCSQGTELIAGVVHDPVFGPLVALGLGGIFAELVSAVSIGIAPLTDVDADELVTGGAVGRLVAGFRGKAPLDAAALADLLHRLSALALDVPEVAELDLNPVLATSSRVRRDRSPHPRASRRRHCAASRPGSRPGPGSAGKPNAVSADLPDAAAGMAAMLGRSLGPERRGRREEMP